MNEFRQCDPSCLRPEPLHFRIGEVAVSLRSAADETREDFAALYGAYRHSRPAPSEVIEMTVALGKRSLRGGRWHVIRGDGQELARVRRAREVMPYLEWGISLCVVRRYVQYLQLHAATLVRNGQGFIFAAPSGSGKSTLAAGLLSRGWKYLSDEFALVHLNALTLHGFPKALCIKAGSLETVGRLNLPVWKRRYYVKALKGRVGYVRPHDAHPQPLADPSPIRYVILPEYVEGRLPRLSPLSRAQAAFALVGHVMNRPQIGDRAMSVLADIVRNAECFRLESGPIGATCDLLESLVGNSGDQPARSICA